jgi:HEAT repeat protein
MFVTWAVLVVACGQGRGEAADADRKGDAVVPLRQVRDMLSGPEFTGRRELVAHGRATFPAFRSILGDADSPPMEVARVLSVLQVVSGDCREFVEPAERLLADENSTVRKYAAKFLGKAGGSKQALSLVALLSDTESTVVWASAEALSAIGDERTLNAMNAWLAGRTPRYNADLREHVEGCRNALRTRLASDPPGGPK